MTEIDELDGAVAEMKGWIENLTQRLGWQDRKKVFLAMIAGLHALRDCLPRDEAVHVGAHLPPLLRGLYYEGWRPAGRGSLRSHKAFLDRIHEGVHRDIAIDPEQVAHAVFTLLAERLPAAELEDAKSATPSPLRRFWPA